MDPKSSFQFFLRKFELFDHISSLTSESFIAQLLLHRALDKKYFFLKFWGNSNDFPYQLFANALREYQGIQGFQTSKSSKITIKWSNRFRFSSPESSIIAIPLKNPLLIRIPPYSSHFSNKGGGGFLWVRGRRKFCEDSVSKLSGQRYENTLKVWSLKRKLYFLSVKPPKNCACGAATLPATQKNHACSAATTQAIIQNVSHVVQKVIIQKYEWC